ncbi:MAG: hypothetical protein HFG56_00745 [Lachnospiraceae bacterium]|nr:hypothetical protein [Lachnospiraceae bacterium]
MKQMNKKVTKILIVLGLLILAAVGMTIAYYNNRKEFENEFRVKAPGVAVYEKFNPTDWWVPGEEKSKEVWFKNTGEQDMLLRFSYSVEWVSVDGKELPPKPASDVIKLNWNIADNNEKGEDKKAEESGQITDIPKDFIKQEQTDSEGKVTTYYYYTKILKAGEPTDLVLESVKFIKELSNDEHGFDYSNQQLNLTIKGETALAVEGAVAEQWKEIPEITAEINQTTGEVRWSTQQSQ